MQQLKVNFRLPSNNDFIAKNRGINSVEILLQENYRDETLTKNSICYNIEGRNYYFIQGKRFLGSGSLSLKSKSPCSDRFRAE